MKNNDGTEPIHGLVSVWSAVGRSWSNGLLESAARVCIYIWFGLVWFRRPNSYLLPSSLPSAWAMPRGTDRLIRNVKKFASEQYENFISRHGQQLIDIFEFPIKVVLSPFTLALDIAGSAPRGFGVPELISKLSYLSVFVSVHSMLVLIYICMLVTSQISILLRFLLLLVISSNGFMYVASF